LLASRVTGWTLRRASRNEGAGTPTVPEA